MMITFVVQQSLKLVKKTIAVGARCQFTETNVMHLLFWFLTISREVLHVRIQSFFHAPNNQKKLSLRIETFRLLINDQDSGWC